MTIPLFESAAAQLAVVVGDLRAACERADAVPLDMSWRSPTGERFRASATTWASELRAIAVEIEQFDESVARGLEFARSGGAAGG